jgi:hypothetical protein
MFTEPLLFQQFPEAKEELKSYIQSELVGLTVEVVHDYVSTTLLPKLFTTWKSERDDDLDTNDTADLNLDDFKRFVGLKGNLSMANVWRWMKWLGMSYSTNKKTYYVDGHERGDVINDRVKFISRYLTTYEPYCERWIQLSVIEAKTIEGLNPCWGYKYTTEENIDCIELHEDNVHNIDSLRDAPRNMSVRTPAGSKPILLLGQDEALFSQYLIATKSWSGPGGESVLNPKSEGDKIMLSAFTGRGIGFGRPLTPAELGQINQNRAGKTYIDEEAALSVNKKTEKNPFKAGETPFVRYLHIGVANEGYWNSNHMALQVEDVVDCLQVLYPGHDVVMLFDHSQGHDRQRDGALNAPALSKGFGGAQPFMRDSKMKQQDLGPYNSGPDGLKDGDVQRMNWRTRADGDVGPFNLTETQREACRWDRPTDKFETKDKTKERLIADLTAKGARLQTGKLYTKKKLQEFSSDSGVDLQFQRQIIEEGWEGKPKGMLQILWERGLIDIGRLQEYTIGGKKNRETGNVDTSMALRVMIADCSDFREEETKLQHLGTQLGITVDRTPKFHAEMAGEGIEYAWGFSKAIYRRKPMARKKRRDGFRALVRECTDPRLVCPDMCTKFSRRAQRYICAYHALHLQQQGGTDAATAGGDAVAAVEDDVTTQQQLNFTDIERMKKLFRSHRCALDFDKGFVHSMIKDIDGASS